MAYIELSIPGNFSGQDMEATVREELHNGTPDLAATELYQISARTPIDTGALLSDEFATPHTNPTDDVLVELGVNDTEQIDQWGRVYAPYQEGGALGLPTYTNPPHEMFARVLTDDIPLIEDWAVTWANVALTRLAAGTGVTP